MTLTNETLRSLIEKILIAGDPLVFRDRPGLAFEDRWVPLDPDEFLAVIVITNKIRQDARAKKEE